MKWKNVVFIPCRNEATAIREVIFTLKKVDPSSQIIVIDNGSSDETAERAFKAGAQVISCTLPGKGRALKAALEQVRADSYTFIDGDGTYDPSCLPEMVKAVREGASMVFGVRRATDQYCYPRFHRFGNWMFNRLTYWFFGPQYKDVLTGFRVLHHQFVESCPLTVDRFEVEAFYSAQLALQGRSYKEIDILYSSRREGSSSKLHFIRDGLEILWCLVGLLFSENKPEAKKDSEDISNAA